MVDIQTPAGSIPAHAELLGAGMPGVVILPSIYGADSGTIALIDSFAKAGISAVIPDLFWRTKPGAVDFDQRREAMDRANALRPRIALSDTLAVLDWMRMRCQGLPAIIGICFGGQYAVMAAARNVVSAAMTWHGGGLLQLVELSGLPRCPLSMHFGESDRLIPLSDVARLRNTFGRNANVAIHLHPDCGHGFTHRGHANFAPFAANAAMADARRLILDGIKRK
ncbi:MAG: carboxymethylenebutenolidase [Myxococcota bacterium]|jgi:carboxymethylenebutenolidase